jgi:hypothetical protein
MPIDLYFELIWRGREAIIMFSSGTVPAFSFKATEIFNYNYHTCLASNQLHLEGKRYTIPLNLR